MRALRSGALMHDQSEKHIELDQRPTLESACGAFRSDRCSSPHRAGSPHYRFSGRFLCGYKPPPSASAATPLRSPPRLNRSAKKRTTSPEGMPPRPKQPKRIAGAGPPLGANDHLTTRLDTPPRCRGGDFSDPPPRLHRTEVLRQEKQNKRTSPI